ncbi:hypothetical protein BT96DRAFT_960722 [Gymnopus androsaceus JB14]|uniref:Uncharacterized protein n=1 Tax=Gymnopus androsaceus JB14 TaxID=1447944 RepID=A0A6A4GJJ4_9AGAR|nr:hypothetical protein BT96DRAFT_960722 [Gymnopus androsaceus JB14]
MIALSRSFSLSGALVLSWACTEVLAQTCTRYWCGKNYMSTEPVINPGGQFPISQTFTEPHIALRCGPAVKPYLPEDLEPTDPTFVSILVDTPVTFTNISGATAFKESYSFSTLHVTVLVDGKKLTSGSVPVNASKHALPFSLSSLEPRTGAYSLTCTASLGNGEQVVGSSLLTYLPAKPADIGGVTKMDMRSGTLLARPATGEDGPYERIFPIGFFTNFGGYLDSNLSIESTLKDQGWVHPLPAFDNTSILNEVLDEMQKNGLWLMYEFSGSYMNDTSVTEQVNQIKSRPNLLLWYSADEPDGTDSLISISLITSLDGSDGNGGAGYHPVSLVLNCENYFWSEYASGADVLLQDTYMIGNNVTFSNQWFTPCTVDFGDCGCDNCRGVDGVGSFTDISFRMDIFAERAFINGWELEKVVWTVPQGFGNSSYWTREPNGEEWVVQSIVAINHGGLSLPPFFTGVVSWNMPTTPDILASSSAFALALTSGPSNMSAFILDPSSTFKQVTTKLTLLLAANMNYEDTTLEAAELGLDLKGFGMA